MGAGILQPPCPPKIRPGKRRSISRVFPRVSPHPTDISTTGRTRPIPPPNPPALYTRLPAPIRVAVKVLSHGSPTLTHATTSYGGHGLPCCHPIRPAYLLHFLLECVRYLIHPRRSLCHDTPSANQSRSSPDEGVILKQYYQKERLQENLLSCKSESCRATLGGRQFLSCLAQPRPNSNANTTYPLCNICMSMYRCCPGSQANQSHYSPRQPPPLLLRSRMHASPTWQGAMPLTPQGRTFSAHQKQEASSALRASCRGEGGRCLNLAALPHPLDPPLYVPPVNAALLAARGKSYGVVSESRKGGRTLLYIYRVCVCVCVGVGVPHTISLGGLLAGGRMRTDGPCGCPTPRGSGFCDDDDARGLTPGWAGWGEEGGICARLPAVQQ